MLPLTPSSVPQTLRGSLDPNGAAQVGLIGEAGAILTQPGAHTMHGFSTQLGAAMATLLSPVSKSNKALEAPTPTELTGNDLPPAGTPLPQNLDDTGTDPITRPSVARAAVPVLGQASPMGAQLLPGFSEPSDVVVPPDLAAQYSQNAEQPGPEQGAETLATTLQSPEWKAPLPLSTMPKLQDCGGDEPVGNGARAPVGPKFPIEAAKTLEASWPTATPKTDTSQDFGYSELRENEGKGIVRSDTILPALPHAPNVVQPSASLSTPALDGPYALTSEMAPEAKASNLNAQPQAPNRQNPGAKLTLEPTLLPDPNENASPPPKRSTAALVSAPTSAFNMQSAPAVASPSASPGTMPAPSSPNTSAVPGALIASPHALVQRFVEPVAGAREMGRAVTRTSPTNLSLALPLPSDLGGEPESAPKPSPVSLPSTPTSLSSDVSVYPSATTSPPPLATLGAPSAPSAPNASANTSVTNAAPAALVERFVDQIADAREAGRAIRPELTMRHGEFGQVGLRIDAGSSASIGEWRAVLMARDPGFVPAVQAALGERIVATSESGLAQNGTLSQRGHENGSPSSGSNPSGQPGSQPSTANGGGEQRYGSSTGDGQGSAKPYSGEEALSGTDTAAADILDTDSSDAAEGASGTSGALFA